MVSLFLFTVLRHYESALTVFLPTDSQYPDRILATGMERFLVTDLHLDPASRVVLILAWKFGARTQGEFTKEEFFRGLHELG